MGFRWSFIRGVAISVTVALGAYVVSAAGAHDQSSITTPDAGAGRNPMTVLALRSSIEPGADKQVVSLFTGPRRALVQITLRNGATLEPHKAAWPSRMTSPVLRDARNRVCGMNRLSSRWLQCTDGVDRQAVRKPGMAGRSVRQEQENMS